MKDRYADATPSNPQGGTLRPEAKKKHDRKLKYEVKKQSDQVKQKFGR